MFLLLGEHWLIQFQKWLCLLVKWTRAVGALGENKELGISAPIWYTADIMVSLRML